MCVSHHVDAGDLSPLQKQQTISVAELSLQPSIFSF